MRAFSVSRILPTPFVFRWSYVNTEKVLYCSKDALSGYRSQATSELEGERSRTPATPFFFFLFVTVTCPYQTNHFLTNTQAT